MKALANKRLLLGMAMLLLTASAASGCGTVQKSDQHASQTGQDVTGSQTGEEQPASLEPFRLDAEQVHQVAVYTGIDQAPAVAGANNASEMIELLNQAEPYDGPVREDFYRMIEVSLKDGTEHKLFFNGSGVFSIDQQTGYFTLSDTVHQALRALVAETEGSERGINKKDIEAKLSEETVVTENTNKIKPAERDAVIDPVRVKEIERPKAELAKPVKGLFQTKLTIKQERDKATLHFSLMNQSEQDQNLTFGSGQQFEITAVSEEGVEVYRWSHGKMFTMALIEKVMNKGDKLEFEEIWEMVDNEGKPVPDGTYTIKVKIMAQRSGDSKANDDAEMSAVSTVVVQRQ